MNIEEARKLCKEEFMKNVMANLDSTLIFTYISNLEKENKILKEKYEKLEDKYIHNVPCCNEEDCELFKEYQQLKDRINKAIEYIENNCSIHNEEVLKAILKEDNKETDNGR